MSPISAPSTRRTRRRAAVRSAAIRGACGSSRRPRPPGVAGVAASWVSPERQSLRERPADRSMSGVDRALQLGFVAGVALARAVEGRRRGRRRLKWPNDLVLDGAKCAGLLVEGVSAPAEATGLRRRHRRQLPRARRRTPAIRPPELTDALGGADGQRGRCSSAFATRFDEALARMGRRERIRGDPRGLARPRCGRSARGSGSTAPAAGARASSKGLTLTAVCCFAGRAGSRRSRPRTSGYCLHRMARRMAGASASRAREGRIE